MWLHAFKCLFCWARKPLFLGRGAHFKKMKGHAANTRHSSRSYGIIGVTGYKCYTLISLSSIFGSTNTEDQGFGFIESHKHTSVIACTCTTQNVASNLSCLFCYAFLCFSVASAKLLLTCSINLQQTSKWMPHRICLIFSVQRWGLKASNILFQQIQSWKGHIQMTGLATQYPPPLFFRGWL